VIDPDTGELLASASVPYPDVDAPAAQASVGRALSGSPSRT